MCSGSTVIWSLLFNSLLGKLMPSYCSGVIEWCWNDVEETSAVRGDE
jgi:hypothetical protein